MNGFTDQSKYEFMKLKSFFAVFLLTLSSMTFIGCDKDDELPDPEGNVTLNMMDEDNGKTLLGASDVFINNANNFRTYNCYLVDQGKTYGLGASFPLTLDNLSQESAVLQGHMYHIYAQNALRTFPSGKQAIYVGSEFYKAYVVAPITSENTITGAQVKYVITHAESNELPAPGTTVFGNLDNWGDSCEYKLPYDAELDYSSYLEQDADSFEIRQEHGVLKVTLKDYPDYKTGPYGEYTFYLRSRNFYTTIAFHVAMNR